MGRENQALDSSTLEEISQLFFLSQVNNRWNTTEVVVDGASPCRTIEFGAGVTQEVNVVALVLPCGRNTTGNVIDDTEHTHNRSGVDGGVTGLVIEGDVSTGDGDLELQTSICQTSNSLLELPHHFGVLWRTEVEAVSDCCRNSTRDSNVAVGLCKSKASTVVGVKLAVATVGICSDGKAETRLFVDANHAGVVREAERRVSHHEVVILRGDEGLISQVGACNKLQELILEICTRGGTSQLVSRVCLEGINPCGVGNRTFVDGTVNGDGARVHVHDFFATVVDYEATGVGYFTENTGFHIPLVDDSHELIEQLRLDHSHHALLAL